MLELGIIKEKFSRCEGCDQVPKGSICMGLIAAVVQLDVDNPDFKEAKLDCRKIFGTQREIIITKSGAVHPVGVVLDEATKAFFGG